MGKHLGNSFSEIGSKRGVCPLSALLSGHTPLEDGAEVVFFNGDEEIGRAKTANGVAELQTTVPDEAATLQLSAVVEDFENDTQEAPVPRTRLS